MVNQGVCNYSKKICRYTRVAENLGGLVSWANKSGCTVLVCPFISHYDILSNVLLRLLNYMNFAKNVFSLRDKFKCGNESFI